MKMCRHAVRRRLIQSPIYVRKARAVHPYFCEEVHASTMTDDQWEFAKAMERFKRDNHRPFPTVADALAVAKSLGYSK